MLQDLRVCLLQLPCCLRQPDLLTLLQTVGQFCGDNDEATAQRGLESLYSRLRSWPVQLFAAPATIPLPCLVCSQILGGLQT